MLTDVKTGDRIEGLTEDATKESEIMVRVWVEARVEEDPSVKPEPTIKAEDAAEVEAEDKSTQKKGAYSVYAPFFILITKKFLKEFPIFQ